MRRAYFKGFGGIMPTISSKIEKVIKDTTEILEVSNKSTVINALENVLAFANAALQAQKDGSMT